MRTPGSTSPTQKPPVRKTQVDEPLSKKLDNPNVAASMDSCEGVESSFVRDQLPIIATTATTASHMIAGIGRISDVIPEPVTTFFDDYSLFFSKAVNVSNYAYKGVEALRENRAWEGTSRLAYSAIVPWAPLESVFTYSGVSSGLTMLEQGQRHHVRYENGVDDPNASEKEQKGTPKSLGEDLSVNFKAFKTMCKETFGNMWGKDRKIFIDPEKDKGHTMFFSAWGNIAGAALGFMAGKEFDSPLWKTASIVRNLGSTGCDWAKLIHKDINNKIAGGLFFGVSGFDVSKSFTDEDLAHTLSHFSNGVNNFANYYYVNTTKTTTDGEFKDHELAPAPVMVT